MSKFEWSPANGATGIDPDEIMDLIPDYVSKMSELNQLEQSNIADAHIWAGKQNLSDLLSVTFLLKLHEQMFNQVWKWAGKMRRSNKNIGVMKEQIMNNLGQLFHSTEHWIANNTFPMDGIAARFHHGLVYIHVFANGNGRHARLMTDLLLVKNGTPKFTWGSLSANSPIEAEGKTRTAYINALRNADQGDFSDLISFARS